MVSHSNALYKNKLQTLTLSFPDLTTTGHRLGSDIGVNATDDFVLNFSAPNLSNP